MEEPNRRAELVKYPHPELEILENLETQELFVFSPKRQEKIIIYKPWDRTAFFQVRYESGKKVPSCEGQYTSRKDAVTAVYVYLVNSKKTDNKKQNDIFGPPPEERPVLKRKKRIPKVNATTDSEDS